MTLTKARVTYEIKQIAKGLKKSEGGPPRIPPPPNETGGPGGGRFPKWSIGVIWLLLGSVGTSFLLLAPWFLPMAALAVVVVYTCVAVMGRWS